MIKATIPELRPVLPSHCNIREAEKSSVRSLLLNLIRARVILFSRSICADGRSFVCDILKYGPAHFPPSLPAFRSLLPARLSQSPSFMHALSDSVEGARHHLYLSSELAQQSSDQGAKHLKSRECWGVLAAEHQLTSKETAAALCKWRGEDPVNGIEQTPARARPRARSIDQ